ncbi:hypothetical protein [Mycolicibacterium baixiangningiae]|uniref:hypothetical protein n=1 Tax=Mycolicibacterium baixiangningiae TaxID=2761578 RepID=UPI001E2A8D25|nr:hypothetical protein [Mycolicibacterium baixiangningiae]
MAIDLYGQELEQRVDEQLRTILSALSSWQQQDTADPVRMQELARVRESVELQAAEAGTLLVVQPPTPSHASSGQWIIGVFLGGLVGGASVVALLLARRRRSGRGAMSTTLTDSVNGVLVPAIDLDAVRADGPRHEERARLARTLYAQCPSAGSGGLLLVIGASPSSGAAEVASLLELGAAEIRPAPATANPSGQHWSPTSDEPSATRVVLGGVVGDPMLTPEVIDAATVMVLVARIDADTAPQAVALRSATASSVAPVVAAFTYRRPASALARKRHKEPQPSPQPGEGDEERSTQ